MAKDSFVDERFEEVYYYIAEEDLEEMSYYRLFCRFLVILASSNFRWETANFIENVSLFN